MTARRRRVLLVLSTIYRVRGGIQRFNQLLCRSLDELAPGLGIEGAVVSQDDELGDYTAQPARWAHLRFVPGGGKRRAAARAVGLCVRQRPDILLVGHLGMTPVGLVCRPFLQRGFGFIAHGTEAWSVPRWSRRLAARRAARVLVVSEYTGRLLARATGLDPRRLRLLPNALEPGLDRVGSGGPGADGSPEAGSHRELLSVARLSAEEREKGIDHTLHAVARLGGRYPDLRYRIVGTGTDKPRLVALADSLGISSRVLFEENLSDAELAERYRRCDVFVLPSGQEGFGIVFLEAMRFGKPCIGSDAGGTPEVVVDGETGLLVPFGDLEQIEAALVRLLQEPTLRHRMGESGRERVREHFVFERFKQRVADHVGEWLGPCSAEQTAHP
jgi:glycosyltransferase involved in cell wall biosynthesis